MTHYCKVCDMELIARRSGKMVCRRCWAQNARTKYKKQQGAYRKKWAKGKGRGRQRGYIRERAFRRCGVRSYNAQRSHKTHKDAHIRFQRWTQEHEARVMSGKESQLQLAKALGRTLAGVQRKAQELRKLARSGEAKP